MKLNRIITVIMALGLLALTACGQDNQATEKLYCAIENYDYDAAQELLESGQELSLEHCQLAEEEYDESRLLGLTIGDDQKMTELLIDAGAELNSTSKEGATYLQELISSNDQEKAGGFDYIQTLLQSGADIEAEGSGDYEGTALEYLMSQSPTTTHYYDEIYQIFMDHGARTTERVFQACMKSDSRFLYAGKLRSNLEKDGENPDLSAALKAAISDQSDEEVIAQIKKGEYKKSEKNNIVFFSAANASPRVMEVLKEEGFDMTQHASGGMSLLDIASAYNTPDMIEYLIKEGQDLEESDDCGYEVETEDDEDMAAFQRIEDAASYTPLSLALVYGKEDNVDCLLKHGAQFQRGAWCVASLYGGEKAVDILLDRNYEPAEFFVYQSYVYGSDDMVRYMLKKGIRYDVSCNGDSLLNDLRESGNKDRYELIVNGK